MNNRSKFVAAALVGGLLSTGALAHAAYRRTPGADCVPMFSSQVGYSWVDISSKNGRADIGCPLPEDDRLPKNLVRQLHIHGRNAGGTVWANVCSVHWYDQNVSCTSFHTTTTAGEYGLYIDYGNLTPAFNANTASDTAGAYVILPSTGSTIKQIFQGS